MSRCGEICTGFFYLIDTNLENKQDKLTNPLTKSDVVNNLTTTTTNVPLSANQGKILKNDIDALSSISSKSVSNIHSWIVSTYVNSCYKCGKSFTINFMFLNGDTALPSSTTIGKIPVTLPIAQKVILYDRNGGWASATVDTNGNIKLNDTVSAQTTYNLESTVYTN